MTSEQQQTAPVRTNHDGDPCPPWCVRNHKETSPGHSAESVSVKVPGAMTGMPDNVMIYPWQNPGAQPEIAVIGVRYGQETRKDPFLWLSVADAEHLAIIVDMLTGATKEQHRQLAAAIRRAGTDITEAGER